MAATMTATPPAEAPPRRRTLKWLAIVAAIAVLLLAIAAIVVPRLADPERHRATLEAMLSQATGWRARLGKLDVTLWNGAAIRAQPVTLISPSGDSSIQIEAVEVHAALRPLLSGTLAVEKVMLVRPRLVLVRQADGRWELPRSSAEQPPPATSTRAVPVDPSTASNPAPGQDPPAAGGSTPAAPSTSASISIREIEVRGGSLQMTDRSAAPGGSLALQELNALITPSTGRLWGQARFAAGPGKVSWQGTIVEGIQLDIEPTTAQVLSDWFGRATIRPAGTFSARLRTSGWTRADVQAEGTGLIVLGGDAALPKVTVQAAVLRDAQTADWSLDGTVDFGGLVLTGGGRFAPSLEMTWRAQHEPIEKAVGALASLGPLPVRVVPPGHIDADVQLSRRVDGPLTFNARAVLDAKSLSFDPALPTLDAVRVTLRLDQRGLVIEPLEGRLAGGAVRLVAQLVPPAPDGTLTLTGTVRGASLESLLRTSGAKQTFPGTANLDVNIAWPLAQGRTIDVVTGTAVLVASDVVLPAWKALGDDATRLDRIDATLRMDKPPWTLDGVRASGPTLTAVGGRGTLQPRRGTIDLPLDVTLAADASRVLTQRVSALKHLQGDSGELQVSGKVSGLLSAPQISLDLERSLLKSGKKPEDLARGLLGDYLKRKQEKKDKKKKDKVPPPSDGGA